MRPLHQGARAQGDRVVHRRARPHGGAGPRRGAARPAHLTDPRPCVGVLLAGGDSARFGGRPKGLARIGGHRIADRVLAALAASTDRQVVIANDPLAPSWFPGVAIAGDAERGIGPLAGLATAIAAGGGDAVLVVAWDMPFVTAELCLALRHRAAGDCLAVAPVHGLAPTVEPLCAWYAAEAGRVAGALVGSGERRAGALFDTLRGRGRATPLDEEGLLRLGDPGRLFTSIDTREALAAAGGYWDAGH